MPKKLIYRSLSRQLNYSLVKKKKNERLFIFNRLQLLDQQFCLGMNQYLYRTYLEIGSSSKQWPVSEQISSKNMIYVLILISKDDLVELAQTNDPDQVEQFSNQSLMKLQLTFDQYSIQLISQATLCPPSMDLSVVEDRLKEFVRLHHLDLIRRIQYQLHDFQGYLHEQELIQQLSSLSIEQV